MGFVKGGESLEANLGRFWALADDEISVSSVEDEDTVTWISRYLVCSPASEGCTLVEAGASALRCREEKKRRQRLAAITLKLGEFFDSVQSDFSAAVREHRFSGRKPKICTPVLSPSTFLLDSFDASEWVHVQRRRRMARMDGPVKNRWVRSSVHRQQKSRPLRDLAPMHQRDPVIFKSVVSELGGVDSFGS
jgi:hypothetical protein